MAIAWDWDADEDIIFNDPAELTHDQADLCEDDSNIDTADEE